LNSKKVHRFDILFFDWVQGNAKLYPLVYMANLALETFDADEYEKVGIDPVIVHLIQLLRYRRMLQERNGSFNELWRHFPIKRAYDKPSWKNIKKGTEAFQPTPYATMYSAAEKAVEAAFFHMGFDVIEKDALEFMVDCFLQKVDKMSRDLSIVHRRRLNGQPCAFKNPLHQVLSIHDLNALDIHKAYHTRVLKRHTSMFNECHKIYVKMGGKEEDLVASTPPADEEATTAVGPSSTNTLSVPAAKRRR
jgi:hypothetical protein